RLLNSATVSAEYIALARLYTMTAISTLFVTADAYSSSPAWPFSVRYGGSSNIPSAPASCAPRDNSIASLLGHPADPTTGTSERLDSTAARTRSEEHTSEL